MPPLDLQADGHAGVLPVGVRAAGVVAGQPVDLLQPDVLGDRADPPLRVRTKLDALERIVASESLYRYFFGTFYLRQSNAEDTVLDGGGDAVDVDL